MIYLIVAVKVPASAGISIAGTGVGALHWPQICACCCCLTSNKHEFVSDAAPGQLHLKIKLPYCEFCERHQFGLSNVVFGGIFFRTKARELHQEAASRGCSTEKVAVTVRNQLRTEDRAKGIAAIFTFSSEKYGRQFADSNPDEVVYVKEWDGKLRWF